MKKVRNRIKVELLQKDDNAKIIKQQSKLTFNGLHKFYKIYDSNNLKQNEVLMDKPIYLRVAFIELSKFVMYET